MDHMSYMPKSPEKSSPSFPEDVEDEEDDPIDHDVRQLKYSTRTDRHDEHETPTDVTMLPEDDEEDDIEQARSFALVVDSPRHPADSSEKKVHWSNQNVQTLLDCVEKHLDEFNIQKKHKQVWQTIGAEMEALGFTMEHCYNKWKNLRRDVRLLVNNPQKAVRNADILRRVARLILVIYPNIDATTMQVSGERNGGKSAPSTPIGSSQLNCRVNLPTALHAPDSPRYIVPPGTPHSLTPAFHHTGTPNGVGKHKGGGNTNCENMETNCTPGAALFTNLASDNDVHNYSTIVPSSTGDPKTNQSGTGFPFFFNPAAAALLVQSQLFTDLLRQQQQQRPQDSESPPVDEPLVHHPAASTPKVAATTTATHTNGQGLTNGVNCLSSNNGNTIPSLSLASTLLNGLSSAENPHHILLPVVSASLADTCGSVDRLPPGSELAGVVERLRDEETVHMRLTDMVTHLADELRAAGMRRRATLDHLLGIMQGSRIPTSLMQNPKQDASNLV
ncbi:Myb/SANT DNA-binding domain [Fasciola gigantica]|uniref:Myb/SANT DNA-binding domain n=1 Tax=Fasciola gigantica TaxID=46835 RepID=A0A504YXF4_FASGI|nr:Myb/SANT DNA-binding domain [Fasciola gigantica]